MYMRMQHTDPIGKFIEERHHNYRLKECFAAVGYYVSRLGVGVCATLLPFLLSNATATRWLSITIVVLTVLDFVVKPAENWMLFSQATSLITLAKIKALTPTDYERYRDVIAVLADTDSTAVKSVASLQEVLKDVKNLASPASTSVADPKPDGSST